MVSRLIQRSGERAGRSYLLGPAVTSIGRGEGNDIVIAGEYISLRHAELRWDGTNYVLHDQESTNGTTLNGRRVTEPQILHSGDLITLPGRPGVMVVFETCAGTAELPAEHDRDAETRLDPDTAELWVRGRRVHVTTKEYRALTLLFERGGALVSKDELAIRVWPEYDGVVADCNVEQLVARLRRKLDGDGAGPRTLLTVRGLGYRLVIA